MEGYIYKRTKDGVHYLDLAKTWEKLNIAARIIGAVQRQNPKDVLVSFFQRAKIQDLIILMASTNFNLGRVQPPICSKSYP
jgi:ribosomal protein S2